MMPTVRLVQATSIVFENLENNESVGRVRLFPTGSHAAAFCLLFDQAIDEDDEPPVDAEIVRLPSILLHDVLQVRLDVADSKLTDTLELVIYAPSEGPSFGLSEEFREILVCYVALPPP